MKKLIFIFLLISCLIYLSSHLEKSLHNIDLAFNFLRDHNKQITDIANNKQEYNLIDLYINGLNYVRIDFFMFGFICFVTGILIKGVCDAKNTIH